MSDVSQSPSADCVVAARRAVVVLVTWPADRDAAAAARVFVDEGLAACVNVTAEMTSTYRWGGEIAIDREHQLILKTTDDRLDALLARVRALHPYELPEFLVLPASAGSARYLAWLQGEDGP